MTVPIREARYLESVLDAAIRKLPDAKGWSSAKVSAMTEVKLVYTTLKRMEMRLCIALKDAVCQDSDHWMSALLRLSGSVRPLLGEAYDDSAVLR